MIRHRIILEKEAEALNSNLKETTLAECFSQEKNRMIMRFISGLDSVFLEINIDLHVGYALISKNFHRAKKNTINFFDNLLGEKFISSHIHATQRVIIINLTNSKQIALIFYGSGSGNIVFLHENFIEDSFHKYSNEYDKIFFSNNELTHNEEEIYGTQELLLKLRLSNEPAIKALINSIPTLGKRLALEALYYAGFQPEDSLQTANDEKIFRLFSVIDKVYSECEKSKNFYIYESESGTVLAAKPLTTLEQTADKIKEFDNIGNAIRAFRSVHSQTNDFELLKKQMLKRLTEEGQKIQLALSRKISTSEIEQKAFLNEQKGKLILENIYNITNGDKVLRVKNFYDEEFEILLDDKLTPAENAEFYFRKYRNLKASVSKTEIDITNTKRRRDAVMWLIHKIETTTTMKELEQLKKENSKLFKPTGEASEKGTAERFRKFFINDKFEIYAGKNATNNDELTTKFARQNDYWFHARGSSGSHVILRWDNSKEKPSKELIKLVASIAAFYSGAKNSKMVPVAYTLKKYVRKPKGAAVGAVVIEKEDVVLVEPKLPNTT